MDWFYTLTSTLGMTSYIEDFGCYNRLGELYFNGADWVPQNYARTVELFEKAKRRGSNWTNDMHAVAKIKGLDVPQDIKKGFS